MQELKQHLQSGAHPEIFKVGGFEFFKKQPVPNCG